MTCKNELCETKSRTLRDHRVAAKNCFLTTRAAKWATIQVGGGRTISEVAKELGCDWAVVNKAVIIYWKALLKADRKRLKDTRALGLDEPLFVKTGKYRAKSWCTTVVDVENHQLIDILAYKNYIDVASWVNEQPSHFKENIEYGALDMSPTYAAVFSVTLPKAIQVVDKFHLIKHANRVLDTVRRRVQQEQFAHRKRSYDPLFRSRKLLLMNSTPLDESMIEKIETLLKLGDPNAEVSLAYRVKEAICEFYEIKDIALARDALLSIVNHAKKKSMPTELQRFARTIQTWLEKIMAYHIAKVTNAPTEGLNNLIKRIKRVGYGFRNFNNYRIRALLYAKKPNYRILNSIVVS